MPQLAGAGFGAAKALEQIIAERRMQQALDAEIRNREGMLAESQRSSQADEAYRQRSLDVQQQHYANEAAVRQREREETQGQQAFINQQPGRVDPAVAAKIRLNPAFGAMLKTSQALPETEGVGPLQEPETQRPELWDERQNRVTNERLVEGQRITAENIAKDNERQATRDKADADYRAAMLAKTPRAFKETIVQTADGPVLVDNETGTARPVIGPDGQPVRATSATERQEGLRYEKAAPVISAIEELSEKINTGAGLIAKMTGGAAKVAAQANYDDDVAEYQSLVSSFTPMVARALGHVGVLTEQDVVSVRDAFPKPGDSKTLRDRKTNRLRSLLGQIRDVTRGAGAGGGGGFVDMIDPTGKPLRVPAADVAAAEAAGARRK